MTTKEWIIWKAYAPIVWTYRWLFVLMSVLLVATVLTKYAQPFLLRHLMNGLVAGESVTNIVVFIGILAVTHALTWLVFDRVITFFETYCMRDIDRRTLEKLQLQSSRFFEGTFTGSLVTSAKRLRHTLEFITDMYVFQLGRIGVMIVLTIIVFLSERPWIGIAFTVWVMAFIAINYYLALYRMRWEEVAATADSAVGGALADTLSNHAAVKTFAREKEERLRFDDITEDCLHKRKKAWLLGGLINRLQNVLVSIFEITVLVLLVREWQKGSLSAGDFVFYQTYLILAIQQLWEMAGALNKAFKHLADAEEMAAIYELEPEVKDAAGARPLIVEEGSVQFHAVDFRYGSSTTDRLAVRNFSLNVQQGETVAIVGPSGAGKSTLIKLLFRHSDPNSGYIRIDRQDISTVTLQSLRQQIALVPQDANLFHRTLRENIAIGRSDATEEEIVDAAKRAHAWDFIERLPSGLDTLVGERGVKLSGGERQRIALARAFLADRPILVLDEATSALDSVTERKIQAAIRDLMIGRTNLVIAHRLSTIMNADRIVVMEDGSIVEIGRHDELVEKGGLYANLWNHQVNGYLPS